MKKRLEANVIPRFGICYFEDGFWATVKRDVTDGDNRILVVVPQSVVLDRHPDLKEEYDKSGGTIELTFPNVMVRVLSTDPACPAIRVMTDIKGNIISNENEETMRIIQHQQRKIEELSLRLLQKEDENRAFLEDFEGAIERWESIRGKIKMGNIVSIPGGGMTELQDEEESRQ